MAWEMSLISVLILGGFIIVAKANDNMYRDCCIRDILRCMNCLPSVPSHVGFSETVPSGDQGCPLKTQASICIQNKKSRCVFYEKTGEIFKYEDCRLTADGFYFDHKECGKAVLELCTEGSESRERYIKHAECINKQFNGIDRQFVDSCKLNQKPGKFGHCNWMLQNLFCFINEVVKNCGKESLLLLTEWRAKFYLELEECFFQERSERFNDEFPSGHSNYFPEFLEREPAFHVYDVIKGIPDDEPKVATPTQGVKCKT